jgi:hypothetical protein
MGTQTPERCIEAAFQFLLDREPHESILRRFDITVISHYFPEFERECHATSLFGRHIGGRAIGHARAIAGEIIGSRFEGHRAQFMSERLTAWSEEPIRVEQSFAMMKSFTGSGSVAVGRPPLTIDSLLVRPEAQLPRLPD